jgi:hypothetical protein
LRKHHFPFSATIYPRLRDLVPAFVLHSDGGVWYTKGMEFAPILNFGIYKDEENLLITDYMISFSVFFRSGLSLLSRRHSEVSRAVSQRLNSVGDDQ